MKNRQEEQELLLNIVRESVMNNGRLPLTMHDYQMIAHAISVKTGSEISPRTLSRVLGGKEFDGRPFQLTFRTLNVFANFLGYVGFQDFLNKNTREIEPVMVSSPLDPSDSVGPVVFISYSWDNEEHSKWVLNLAKSLILKGVEVILDQFDLFPGKNAMFFMEDSAQKADKVLIIFTPKHKEKADVRKGGAGFEYSVISTLVAKYLIENDKFIPILREGDAETAISILFQQFIYVDLRGDINSDKGKEQFHLLLRSIYGLPPIDRPQKGKPPKFD